jgi:DNA-binding response OmpR family regulator
MQNIFSQQPAPTQRHIMATPFILIAEDEADTARLIAYHLRRRGYGSVTAHNGLAALNAVFERKPSLVILDRMMPQMQGLEVCRLIKASPSRKTPVLMLTAMASTENKLEGFNSGADDYMTKPFEMRELLARVAALLRRTEINEERRT